MSVQFKRELARWLTLLFGASWIASQIYDKFTGGFEGTIAEACGTIFAVVLMFKPLLISDAFKTIINFKFGKKDAS